MWSSTTIQYDDNYALYIQKTHYAGGSAFTGIPGMKLGDAEGDPLGAMSIQSCQFDCMNSKTCRSVSYNQAKSQCILSDTSITIGSDWDYFEKKNEIRQHKMAQEEMAVKHKEQTLKIVNALRLYNETSQRLAPEIRAGLVAPSDEVTELDTYL